MGKLKMAVWGGVCSLLLIQLSGCFIPRNEMVRLKQEAETALSNVAVQYDNRNRQIPNLLKIVQTAVNAEEQIVVGAIKARAEATSAIKLDASIVEDPEQMAKFQKAQAELNSGIGRLMAIGEAYPDPKSQERFADLQSQFEGAENRITVAQTRYNLAVQKYNTYIMSWPGVAFAEKYGFKPMQLFAVNENLLESTGHDMGAIDLGL